MLGVITGQVGAHGGGLGGSARAQVAVPTWLLVATGGAAVGVSFLLASFATDRALLRSLEHWEFDLPAPGRLLSTVPATLGVFGLAVVLWMGLFGPRFDTNPAILIVWVGWWAGYTISTYLVGNSWPAVNPWRTIGALLPSLDRAYPQRLGAWPAVGALLVLVWIEIASPLAADPRALAAVVTGYTVVTLLGTTVYGCEDWFRWADPIARVFRAYGAVAPIGSGPTGRLPGSGLQSVTMTRWSEVAFAVALLWVTTFDGFVATPVWRDVAMAAVGAGLMPWLVYPLGMVVGFSVFFAVYVVAARMARRTGDTYRTSAAIAMDFAPSLFAIAAGYHLAHYLPYFVSTVPALGTAVTTPFSTSATLQTIVIPEWFVGVGMGAILLGHLLAVWAAHTRAFDCFPDRMQAIRSQYPLVAVMVAYTAFSLWIVGQPTVAVVYA